MLAATPHAIVVTPTHEIRTVAPVNEVTVDGGRAATLVGETREWEYILVWTPRGIVVRASISCDTQESNLVLAGNRFAHLCFQDANYVVTGTIRPLHGRVAMKASPTAIVSLEGTNDLIAGTVGSIGPPDRSVVWRFDPRTKKKLRTYKSRAVLVSVDRGRLLIDRPRALDVLSHDGTVVSTLRRAHDGGAVMRGGQVATIAGRRLSVSHIDGQRLVTRTVAAGAHLEDIEGGLVVYSVETRLHLFRLSDGKDVALRLPGQYGYAHAELWRGSLFYAYNQRSGRVGHADYLDAAGVRSLLHG